MLRWTIVVLALAIPAMFWPVFAQAIAPDPTLTPGAVRTTDVADVCSHGTSQLRNMTSERRDWLMREYGLPPGPHPDYELDHLIPLGIGGDDRDANIWPEPRATVESEWTAERKDQLEAKLRALVCAGRLDIVVAQKAVADDWTEAWLRYVHFFPLPGEKPFAVDFGGERGRGAQGY